MQKKTKKKQKWTKFRHKVVRTVGIWIVYPYVRIKYRIRIRRFKEQEKRPYLILFNHQTALDQFIVGSAFKRPVYYVASEDIFSNGKISRLIEWAVAPIPIKKQATDARAVLNCLRVAKEGGTIALAPEGNRTFSGKTEYIKPAIVALVKALKLPVVFYRIEGGYGVHPRWSDIVRRGKSQAYVSKVVMPEEYLAMSEEAFADMIVQELTVNEGNADNNYRSKKGLAEYIERAYYVCPDCGLTRYESHGDFFTCQTCKKTVRYMPNKELKGEGFEFPFRFTTDWYEHQRDFINGLDLLAMGDKVLYEERASLFKTKFYDRKILIEKAAKILLRADGIFVETKEKTYEFPFATVSTVTVLGKNKVNLYMDGELYQLKGDKRFNGVKFVQLCYRAKNQLKGEDDGEFLGL